jgi:hypothetical protein
VALTNTAVERHIRQVSGGTARRNLPISRAEPGAVSHSDALPYDFFG